MAYKKTQFKGKLFSFKEKEMTSEDVNFVDSELSNKTVILNFWGHWCGPCLEEFPSLVKLNSLISKDSLKIIAINTDELDQLKKVSKVIRNFKLDFPIVFDQDSKITEMFEISAIPVSILMHKGKYVESFEGGVDFSSIEFINKIKELTKTN
ncbi:MAG: TlpA family protein disulfide reductase [Halobacteriovoraceae bacterium]|nr:TlpA family protein disulfide reductase [Halobacteriovoraceae bacterium]